MTQPVTRHADVLVAGVPWPRHKLFAVVTGLVALALIGVVTSSAATAVLGGAALAVAVGVLVKTVTYQRD